MKRFSLLLVLLMEVGLRTASAQAADIAGEMNVTPGGTYGYTYTGRPCGDMGTTYSWFVSGGTGIPDNFGSIVVTWDCSTPAANRSIELGTSGFTYGIDSNGDPTTDPVSCNYTVLNGFTDAPSTAGTIAIVYTNGFFMPPAGQVCSNQPYELAYSGSAGVQRVTWSVWNGGSWQVVSNTSTSPDFRVTVAGISGATTYQARAVDCSGTQLPTQTITVDVINTSAIAGVVLGTRDVLFANNQGTLALADYTGYVQNWQSSEDDGATWRDLAESGEQLDYENLTATTLYRVKFYNFTCQTALYSQSCAIRVGTGDSQSWIESTAYGAGNQVVGKSRAYFDMTGRLLQSQAKNLTRGKVLATQPLMGRYDQAVGSTLAAPILETEFTYKPNFVTPTYTASIPYNYTHFDGTSVNNPVPVGNTPGTLGWYYSLNNTIENFVANTSFPYSRSDEAADGSTGVVRSSGVGEALRMGQGKENVQGTFSVRSELDTYAQLRNRLFPSAVAGEQITTFKGAATQQVVVNANGQKAVTFQDKEGHTVMTARPGTATSWLASDNTVEIGWPFSFVKDANQLYTNPVFEASANIQVYDANSNRVFMGNARDFDLTNKPDSYRIYSNEFFRIVTGPILNATTGAPLSWNSVYVFNASEREAYARYNFCIFQDAQIPVTSLISNSDYTVTNTVTGADVTSSFKNNANIQAGFYQVRILAGAIRFSYHNEYQDISYAFYNQKGQLLGSLAPKGVKLVLDDLRNTGLNTYGTPATLPFYTSYSYDVRGGLLALTDADVGTTRYYYRNDGTLRFSQSAKQQPLGYFSYTNYDDAGRPVEAGECRPTNLSYLAALATDPAVLESTDPRGGFALDQVRQSVVLTTYDLPVTLPATGGSYAQDFLAGRVSFTLKYETWTPQQGAGTPVSQTWFSYDEQGRTQWVVRRLLNQTTHTLDYAYDLLGKVLTVCYQQNDPATRFTHYYTYDADQRLSEVRTNNAAPTDQATPRQRQALYSYYLHGPLKRVVIGSTLAGLGTQGLQGMDYVYTAQGWLKSINGIVPYTDPGRDDPGTTGTLTDLFAQELEYYTGDVTLSGSTAQFLVNGNAGGRYDGTLRASAWVTPTRPALQGYGYEYDERGQLKQSYYGQPRLNSTRQQIILSADPLGRYAEGNLSYDPNGNLLSLRRTDRLGQAMMDISYQYLGNTNKLQKVNSQVPTLPGMEYSYDALGQMTAQVEAGATKYLDYDVTGKVTDVYRDAAKTNRLAQYVYDEFGQRIKQTTYNAQGVAEATLYVRDASGHEVASYYYDPAAPTVPQLAEQPIYGAARLGVFRPARDKDPADQLYELNDQLGNTRVVFHAPRTSTYVLTMEDGRTSQEKEDFDTPADNGATYNQVRSNQYSRKASPYGQGYSMQLAGQVGPGKKLAVAPGDRVLLEVYAGYPAGGVITGRTNPQLTLLGAGVGTLLMPPPRPLVPNNETPPVSGWQRALGKLSIGISIPLLGKQRPTPGNADLGGVGGFGSLTSAPKAMLNYTLRLVRDRSVVRTGQAAITTNAAGQWELLSLNVQVDTEEAAELEVWVQNDDQNFVYFDDLRIEHRAGPVVAENHFYAYGQRNEGLSWTRQYQRPYGRGYQGQNTRFDAETGYDNFELRLYDARIGRWLSTDPMGQYHSPYVSMGNDPVNSTDSNGGVSSPIFSSSTGRFLGNDSEGFRGQILFMSDTQFLFLSANSQNGVIDHKLAVSNSQFVNTLGNLYVVNQALDYVRSLTVGINADRLYNGSISTYSQGKSFKPGDDEWVNGGNKKVDSDVAITNIIGNKIKVTYGELYYATTVEDVQSTFVHEYVGHGVLGAKTYEEHFMAFEAQMKHPSYAGTTADYKKNIVEGYTLRMKQYAEYYHQTGKIYHAPGR